MPKISILIPVYKSEKYINECIESVLNQTIHDIEIICIDDCGNDNTMRIVEEYVRHDSRIKLLYNEHNLGQYASLLHGFEHANGEYIYCLDNDDYIDINYLKEMSDILDNNKNIAYVFNPNIKKFYADNNKIIYKEAKKFPSLKFFYKKYIICPCDNKTLLTVSTDFTPKLYRKSVLLESRTCGFNGNINFNDRILFTYCKSIAIVNSKCSYYYRQLSTSSVHNTNSKQNYLWQATDYARMIEFYNEKHFFNKICLNFQAIAHFMDRTIDVNKYFNIIKSTIKNEEISNGILANIKLYNTENLIALKCFLECNSYDEFNKKRETYIREQQNKRRLNRRFKQKIRCIAIIFVVVVLLMYLLTKM